MAITVRKVETSLESKSTLAEVREEVLAAAKTAAEQDKVVELSVDPQLMGALGAAEYARQKGLGA